MKQLLMALSVLALSYSPSAQAYEVYGMFSYDGTHYNNKPSDYADSSGGVGYGFFGRFDFGPGQIESGFMFMATSYTTNEFYGTIKTSGSFFIIPVLYRYYVLPPFLSVAFGPDYAILGFNRFTVNNNEIGNAGSIGYQSQFGLEADVQAVQDIGNNTSALIDFRYRYALSDPLSIDGQGIRFQTFMISLGLQKRFE